jgi:DNA repair exonuclease SbcCD ATPase subunit
VLIPIQKKQCSFYLQGRCKFGDKCLFYHPTEYLQPLKNKLNELEKENSSLRNQQMPHQVHVQKLQSEIDHLKKLNSCLNAKLNKIENQLMTTLKPKISNSRAKLVQSNQQQAVTTTLKHEADIPTSLPPLNQHVFTKTNVLPIHITKTVEKSFSTPKHYSFRKIEKKTKPCPDYSKLNEHIEKAIRLFDSVSLAQKRI